jgi:hypothetical protein
MSKLAELLTEAAKQSDAMVLVAIQPSGRISAYNGVSPAIYANDEAGLIAKLQEYLLKEKNQ